MICRQRASGFAASDDQWTYRCQPRRQAGSLTKIIFGFTRRRVESLGIQVAAARLDSPLDSVIEVLDAQGKPIPRATVRCKNQTTTTLADRDSRTTGMRLVSTSGLREGDYLMIGDELDRIAVIPDQPDADIETEGIDGVRMAFLGTSPDVHARSTHRFTKPRFFTPTPSFRRMDYRCST